MALPESLVSFLRAHPLTLADAGARGGFHGLEYLAPWINVHAFEADAEEAGKLEQLQHSFASYTVHPFALSNLTSKRKLHLARQRSMSSFLAFDREEFQKHFGKMRDAEKWMRGFETEKITDVNCITLDSVFPGNAVIDFLKLDTQGTELEILQGAKMLLEEKRIMCIEVEVNMQPVYKGQPAFSVVNQFLRAAGFLLVDYRVNVHAFSADATDALTESVRVANGGDAVYVLNPELLPQTEQKDRALIAALLLAHKGYLSIADHLLRSYTTLGESERNSIYKMLNRKSAKEKRKAFARKFLPPVLLALLKK